MSQQHYKIYLTILAFAAFLGACSFTERIKDGSMAYERKQYSVATDMLSKEFQKSNSRVERGKLAFMLGRSWSAIGENEKSIEWYKQAYDNAYGEDALIQYAFALKKDEQYNEAAKIFKEVGIETGDPITFRKEISACTYAEEWKNTPVEQRAYDISASPINTAASEYAPAFLDNDDIVFTSDRDESEGEDRYNWTGRGFSDLFIKEGNSVKSMDGPFNSKHNDGTISFNRDRTYAVFTRCHQTDSDDSFCELMESTLIDGNWTAPQVLPFVESEINYGQPSVSPEGDVIFFASNHPDGWGGFDLYRVSKSVDEWNEPVILPLRLNTIEDEQFPFVIADTLYFASTGHGGMGGLDIYKTYIRSNGDWAPVENLKYPINSGADDFGYIIRSTSKNGKVSEGYFTSNRKEGQGSDDIYAFTQKNPVIPEPEVVIEKVDSAAILAAIEKNKKKYKIIGFVIGDQYENPNDPNSKIENSSTPINNAKVTIKMENLSFDVSTDDRGYFEYVIENEGNYDFQVSADGYLNNTAMLEVDMDDEDTSSSEQLFKVEVKLDRLFKNIEINLDNIYYAFNKAEIREDAKPTLLELAAILDQNPQINIQLSSHTDCRGEVLYNEDLSQRRAQSAVDYLVSQGISPERMVAKGYGESRPADPCECNQCSEAQHQTNRRTTFKIIE